MKAARVAWSVAWAVAFLLTAGGLVAHVAAQEASGATPEVYIPESGEDRIVLIVNVPPPVWGEQTLRGKTYDTVSLPGWGHISQAGSPQLPLRRFLLGIPPEAEVRLTVRSGTPEVRGPYRLLPAPRLVPRPAPPDAAPWDTPPLFERHYEESRPYETDAFYPTAIARLAEIGMIRSRRIAAVEVTPLRYNPKNGLVEFYPRIEIELAFSYPHGRTQSHRLTAESPLYERILQDYLLNYDSARSWRGLPQAARSPQATAAQSGWPLPAPAYKIPITRTGLYQITYDRLAAAGLPVDTLDPRTLQMFLNGQEIAIQVIGQDDGVLDPDDYILFYGQSIRHKYTKENVYWLTYGRSKGRRMKEQPGQLPGKPTSLSNHGPNLPIPTAFTQHLRIEEDHKYQNKWPGDDWVDRWYWALTSSTPDDITATLTLRNLATETTTATLWASMWGYNADAVNPDHHVQFYVNGKYIGEHWWDGNIAVQWVQIAFPQSYLISGTNTLQVHVPGDTGAAADLVMFDRFELEFGHAYRADDNMLTFSQPPTGPLEYAVAGFRRADVQIYDVTLPTDTISIVSATVEAAAATYTVRFSSTAPTTKTYLLLTPDRRLAPARIISDSPSTLHDPTNGADYVLITHPDFTPAAETLAAYRSAQGLRTMVVDLTDVYDEFGYGLETPQAIHDFLRYAFERWEPPAPTYVLLLGDATFDPKDNYGLGDLNFIPTYLAAVDPWMRETAADNRYVTVSGDDRWPDMLIGRLPANSLEEANVMVAKTLAYERTMGGADWNNHLTFVAGEQPDPQGAGNFHDLSDDIVDHFVPGTYTVSKIYLGSIPGSTCVSGDECRQMLINTLNTTGTLFVNYIGHSARNYWSAHILDLPAVDLLTNDDRLPIMLPMTCLDGWYIYPGGYKSLSEGIVSAANGGAVASWAPAGLGVVEGHDRLNKGFLEAALTDGIRELGAAALAGKLRLYNTGSHLDQIDTYHVLGDPALRINLPPYRLFLPFLENSG